MTTTATTTTSSRKTQKGLVLRRSGAQTIVVQVTRVVAHPTMKKYVRRRKNYAVHDAQNLCQVGDEVIIRESRPYSRTKRWEYLNTLKHTEAPAQASA